MKNTVVPLIIFFLFVCFSSCQKEFLYPNGNSSFDADASRFIDAAGITDNTEKTALNNLVLQLKDSLIWTKFTAIYPMVGGSESFMKWNLKDPRDLDVAYRLTFFGTPVYAPHGVLFPTTADYADTHFNDSALDYKDNAISYYSGTQNNISGYDMGCYDTALPANEMAIYHAVDASNWSGYFDWGRKPVNTKGLFMFSALASDVKRYEDGFATDSSGAPPVAGLTGYNILLGKVTGAPTGGQKQCQLATIGYGLTDAQALTFSNIAKNFQAALRR